MEDERRAISVLLAYGIARLDVAPVQRRPVDVFAALADEDEITRPGLLVALADSLKHLCGGISHRHDAALTALAWTFRAGAVIPRRLDADHAASPLVAAGGSAVRMGRDGWTVSTADGSLVAHAEHTIVVRAGGPLVFTA